MDLLDDLAIPLRQEVVDTQTGLLAARNSRYFAAYHGELGALIIKDALCGVGRSAGCWKGDRETLINSGWRVLDRLKIDRSEVIRTKIYVEWHQGVQRARQDRHGRPAERKPRLMPRQQGSVWTRFFRVIDGIPVWSSSLTLELTRSGTVGFLLLHWPSVPSEYVKAAAALCSRLEHGSWAQSGNASVDNARAVVLHSPPFGTTLELVSCIRVEYRKSSDRIGKIPIAYIDENGEPVRVPSGLPEPWPEGPRAGRGPRIDSD
jgi:hypothetical protein